MLTTLVTLMMLVTLTCIIIIVYQALMWCDVTMVVLTPVHSVMKMKVFITTLYNVQVISKALQMFGVELVPLSSQRMRHVIQDPTSVAR